MKVVFLSSVWPEPCSSAAGTRTMELLEMGLAAGWDICFAATAQRGEYSADLSALSIRCQDIQLNDARFDVFIAAEQPDLVIFDRFMVEEQFGMRVAEHCPQALRVLDTSDLHFLRRARMTAVNKQEALNLYTDDMLREIAAIGRSDLSLLISDYEMNLLQETFGIKQGILHYCPFMLPEPAPAADFPAFKQRKDFVMIGNFLHKPNLDAVRWVARDIWPLIKAAMPDASCDVYGAYARDVDKQLSRPDLDFIIRGRAEDARDCLSRYRVNLAALRYGAGIKGKIADGCMVGTPCVTTAVGAEAMHGDLPWGGRIADDPAEIALSAQHLYTNEEEWRSAQTHGFAIIRQRFSARQQRARLLERVQELMADPEAHRREQLLGLLLTQQSLKSTYYMSKWIEEKHKP